jgi:hypothetical protein
MPCIAPNVLGFEQHSRAIIAARVKDLATPTHAGVTAVLDGLLA